MMNRELQSSLLVRRPGGFTLIEVMVVVFFLGVLSIMVQGTLNGFIATKNNIESRQKVNRVARNVMLKMSEELQSAIPEPLFRNNSRSQSGRVMSSRDHKDSGQSSDTLSFVSRTGAQSTVGVKTNAGPVQIDYRLQRAPESEASKRAGVSVFYLARAETPAYQQDLAERKKLRTVIPLASNLVSFNLRFLVENEWQDGYREQNLPKAVEISIELLGDNSQVYSFKTAVAIIVSES